MTRHTGAPRTQERDIMECIPGVSGIETVRTSVEAEGGGESERVVSGAERTFEAIEVM